MRRLKSLTFWARIWRGSASFNKNTPVVVGQDGNQDHSHFVIDLRLVSLSVSQ